MFLEILITMVIILILNFGVDLGPNALWIIAGAGIATLATLWLTRKGPFSGRELPLGSLLESCDEAARSLENRLMRTA